MFVKIADLEGAHPETRQFIESLGQRAHIWPELNMAAIRSHVVLPSEILDGLASAPVSVNRQRWALIDGMEAMLTQGLRHWRSFASNGNLELASTAGGDTTTFPEMNETSGQIERNPGPLQTRLGRMAAINLSLGLSVPGEFDPDDPINAATARMSLHVPVVMAAGNASGLRRAHSAFNKWSKAPWVVAVSALRDGRLAEDSAEGRPDDNSFGPTVAAPDDRLTVFHTDSGEVEAHRGTSIAAAVVSGELISLASFTLTVRSAVMRRIGLNHEGVPRVGVGILDTGFDREKLSVPTWPYGSLPIAGLDDKGVQVIADVCSDERIDSAALLPTPSASRHLLLASARPVKDHDPHQVGVGEISPGTTAVYLARITAGQFLQNVLAPGPTRDKISTAVDDIPLTGQSLPAALQIWRANAFPWFYDFRRPGPLWNLTFVAPKKEE
jgi:hypothetical protein